jgi:MYXO-CTERM domain-containing protein
VSSFGDLRQWAPDARAQHGADFRLLYVYVLAGGMESPDDFRDGYLLPFVETARSMDAVPVLTFYQLLHLGQAAGHSGTEPEVVAAALDDAAVMRTYVENFVWLLDVAAGAGDPVLVHVEPDSWGFMMWAMGVEGNADPTTIPAQVSGSGHPDAAGFPDHAGGLGRALVHLRDVHAPGVRLGWHASNFRVGTRPEVVSGFFAGMGDWDVLVGEHPHLEADEATWWEPWDPAAVDTNLAWARAVTTGAGLPLILWQVPLGTMDWHLLGVAQDRTLLERFAGAGVVAVLFEHQAFHGETDPDAIRAAGDLGTPPPAGSPAGGTAADLRARVAAYSDAPLAWPEGTVCASGVPTVDAGPPPPADGGGAPGDGSADGCGCAATGGAPALPLALLVAVAAIAARRRRDAAPR